MPLFPFANAVSSAGVFEGLVRQMYLLFFEADQFDAFGAQLNRTNGILCMTYECCQWATSFASGQGTFRFASNISNVSSWKRFGSAAGTLP
ncbi:hypothetical protein M514_17275 [Trichuris suis]|uniref:Uncharacterized protein n=1 Tax=Trichuris suis TaxID=68888 RepID=A0A085NLY6_9BILA|nr:hypothetical protein M514_17275 [Trichuris suis]